MVEPTTQFDELLTQIGEDPTGIFGLNSAIAWKAALSDRLRRP
jgi:hypothetical protein